MVQLSNWPRTSQYWNRSGILFWPSESSLDDIPSTSGTANQLLQKLASPERNGPSNIRIITPSSWTASRHLGLTVSRNLQLVSLAAIVSLTFPANPYSTTSYHLQRATQNPRDRLLSSNTQHALKETRRWKGVRVFKIKYTMASNAIAVNEHHTKAWKPSSLLRINPARRELDQPTSTPSKA